MPVPVLLAFVVLVAPAAAASRVQGVDLCEARPSAAEAARNHRAGLVVPEEPFTAPCPPGYRAVHRSSGGLY